MGFKEYSIGNLINTYLAVFCGYLVSLKLTFCFELEPCAF